MAQSELRSIYAAGDDVVKPDVISFLLSRKGHIVSDLAELRAWSDAEPLEWVLVMDTLVEYTYSSTATTADNGDTVIVDALNRRYLRKNDTGKADTLFRIQFAGTAANYVVNPNAQMMEVQISRSNQVIALPSLDRAQAADGNVVAIKNKTTQDYTGVQVRAASGDTINFSSDVVSQQQRYWRRTTQFFVGRRSDRTWHQLSVSDAFGHPQQAFEHLEDQIQAGDWLEKEVSATNNTITLNQVPNGVAEPIAWDGNVAFTKNRLHIYSNSVTIQNTLALPISPNDGDFVAVKRASGAGDLSLTVAVGSGVNLFGLEGGAQPRIFSTGAMAENAIFLFTYKSGAWTAHRNIGDLAVSIPKVFEALKHIAQTDANDISVNEDSYTIAFPSGGNGGGNSTDFAGFLNYVAVGATRLTADFNTIYEINATANFGITLPAATDSDIGRTVWVKNTSGVPVSPGIRVSPAAGQTAPIHRDIPDGDYLIYEYRGSNIWAIHENVADLFAGVSASDLNAAVTNGNVPPSVNSNKHFNINGGGFIQARVTDLSTISNFPRVLNTSGRSLSSNYQSNLIYHLAATGSISITLPAANSAGIRKGSLYAFRKISFGSRNQILSVGSSSTISNNPFAPGATSNNTWNFNDWAIYRSTGTQWDYVANPAEAYINQSGVFQALKKIAPTATFNDANETMTISGAAGGEKPITTRRTHSLTSNITASNAQWLNSMVVLQSAPGNRTVTMPNSFGADGDRIIFGSASSGTRARLTANIPSGFAQTVSINANDTLTVRKLSGRWYFTAEHI